MNTDESESNNYPWGDARRFSSYANYFRKRYGSRIQKLTVDAGFSCPNRDGKVGTGGCTYCDNRAFNPSYCQHNASIRWQLEEGIKFHANRYRKADRFLAYFQAYSNTYGSLELLKTKYQEALSVPQVIGIVIGTRPDCVDEPILDYLAELSGAYEVIVEYGVESCYDSTLKRINRGHDFETAKRAIEQTASRGIQVGAHFMFGLPGERKEDMLAEAEIISALPLDTVKFHQLQLVKGTKMVQDFEQHPGDFVQFELNEYIDFFIDFLEVFNPDIVIERFAGEVPPWYLEQSNWGMVRNEKIWGLFEKRLTERDTWQGKRYKSNFEKRSR